MDPESVRLLITGLAGTVGAVSAAVVVGLLNRSTTREARNAVETSESAAWSRAQLAEREAWLRVERKRAHLAFLEVLAELTALAANNPTPGPPKDWTREYKAQNADATSKASRLLTEVRLVSPPATYAAARDLFWANSRRADLLAQEPSNETGASPNADTEDVLARMYEAESVYLFRVRTDLAIHELSLGTDSE
ncbi:hypothetical protein AYX22_01630 [Arthrobacter sp. D5-1]|nr:hypothetical protein AYX22_01630 [Arthrobacter sp. D5-1]